MKTFFDSEHMKHRQVSRQERYQRKKREKVAERAGEQRARFLKKFARAGAAFLAAGSVIGGIGWFIAARPSLPPTTAEGHTEDMPPSHISSQPIPDSTQRYMLEHADGNGMPGVLVQYNCAKYSCEQNLAGQLVDLIKQYPANVYLAPNSYDGKIVLTRLGRMEVLESFDATRIKNFIEG